jgi:hypothetical protein
MIPQLVILIRGGCIVRIATANLSALEDPIVNIVDVDNLAETTTETTLNQIISDAFRDTKEIY